MTKQEFLNALRQKLSGLPTQEAEERLNFYSEMIDDRIEEGIAEEMALSEIGTVDEVADQIIKDIPFLKIAKEKIKPKRRFKAWEIVLLALGSPIWLSLALAALAVALSLYAALWSVLVSLWAVFISLAACGSVGVFGSIALSLSTGALGGIALIATCLVCAGLAIFSFFGCKAATKGTVWLTRKMILGTKKCFVRKEKAQ